MQSSFKDAFFNENNSKGAVLNPEAFKFWGGGWVNTFNLLPTCLVGYT
jgi:hypothetical protein